jgi:hypothetical protein
MPVAETTTASWKPLPEPGRLQLTAATDDLSLDNSAGNENSNDSSEVRITWAPASTSSEPPLLSDAVADEASPDITPTASVREVEQQVESAANVIVNPIRPCTTEDCDNAGDELLVRCIEHMQRWRTWLAVAGLGLILLGWVGRGTSVK